MVNSLACPHCNHEIELTELMRTQVASQIRRELDAQAAARERELDKQNEEVSRQKRQLEKDRESIAEQIRVQVEYQQKELIAEANKRAKDAVAIELADRDEQLKELSTSLASAQEQELELRKMQRTLQSEKDMLKLEVQRQLDAQRSQLIAEVKAQFDQENQLKQAEKDKTISDMTIRLREMQRKIEQGSQQLQGEVQELALENLLSSVFPTDTIAPVAKGTCGGDAIQQVFDPTGLNCGSILWESKRTKNWSNAWLTKVRDDQRSVRAVCVVIVSETLPSDVKTFALIEGVWVCSWGCVKGLAAALRSGLIEVGKSKLVVQGQNQKMDLVYNYLAGREFKQRVEGVVEAFMAMQGDLASEKMALQRIWSKREKQLERALHNTASLYGDLQGIIGASMPTIEGLAFPRIEADGFPKNLSDG